MRNSSLERLVTEHLPDTLRFAVRLTGDPHRAEEIVQEALLRAVRSWPSFRGASTFRTWLYRIVINVFRDTREVHPHLPLDDQAEPLDASAEPPAAALAAELSQHVAREVSRLPQRQREVLVLVAYEGLSPRATAQLVGISEANVHSTLWAARARLKARLAPYLKSIEN